VKKYFIIICFLFLVFGLCIILDSNSTKEVFVNYNGNNLMINIDGNFVDELPTSGNYYLVSYSCDNENTKIIWNRNFFTLSVSNGTEGGGVACDLNFKSKPLLSEMPVGSYVEYVGSGGTVGTTSVACQNDSSLVSDDEAPLACTGQNVGEYLDDSGYTYGGGCSIDNFKYYVTGWRIAYINDNKAIIVSAGAPECISAVFDDEGYYVSDAQLLYNQTANTNALKYCNVDYVDGDCSCVDADGDGYCDSASNDAWAIGDTDFYYMTKAISGVGKRLSNNSSSLGDVGGTLDSTLFCFNKFSYQECGYNNDLIDNGGAYFFVVDGDWNYNVLWYPFSRIVYRNNSNDVSGLTFDFGNGGLRPMISLSSKVYVTGGSGTMNDPYQIAKM